jgi:hypothetical protein
MGLTRRPDGPRLLGTLSPARARRLFGHALNASSPTGSGPNDSVIGPAPLARFDAATPLPTTVLPDEMIPDSLIVPVIARLEVAGRSFPVWVTRLTDYVDGASRPKTLPSRHIGVSNGVWLTLQRLDTPPGADGRLIIDTPRTLRVAGALASDLPRGNDVHVSPELASQLGRRAFRRKPECLLSTTRLCAPVHVVGRPGNSSLLRAGMLTRALFELKVADDVQLSRMPQAQRQLRRSLSSRAKSGPPATGALALPVVLWGAAILVGRLLDDFLEMVLRLLIRAPQQPVRVVQAHPGDDSADRRIVRLHPSTFPVLGITPGMQVFVRWGRGRTIAIALEDYQPHSPDIPTFLRSRQAAGTRSDLPGEFPPHLVARVSLSVRFDLGMSSDTVATVRRRLRTAVLSQLNQLSIPVAGLILAALAVPDFRGWRFYSGLALVVILGLLPLRKPPPPRGRWP